MKRAWELRCLLVALLLHCALFGLLPWPQLTLPLLLGAFLGGCGAGWPVAVGVWLLTSWLGPPQWLWWSSPYNESQYLIQDASPWILSGPLILLSNQGFQLLPWTPRARSLTGVALVLTLILLYPFKIQELSPQFTQVLAQEPAPGYVFDGIQQLKAFHLYQKGFTYHEASKQSFVEDGRGFQEGFVGLSMRSPLLFWMLGRLPNPGWLAPCSWLLSGFCALAIYLATCKLRGDPLLSLASPALFLALQSYPQSNYWLLFQDLWATQFLILGICALVFWPNSPLALMGLALSFGVREFNGMILVVALAVLGVRNRKLLWTGLSLLAACLALYYYNHLEIQRVLAMQAAPLGNRFEFSPTFAALTARFGSIRVLSRELLMPLLFLGSLLAPWLNRSLAVQLLAFQSAFLLLLFLMLGKGGAHYAFNLSPVFCWAATLGLASQEKPKTGQKANPREPR